MPPDPYTTAEEATVDALAAVREQLVEERAAREALNARVRRLVEEEYQLSRAARIFAGARTTASPS